MNPLSWGDTNRKNTSVAMSFESNRFLVLPISSRPSGNPLMKFEWMNLNEWIWIYVSIMKQLSRYKRRVFPTVAPQLSGQITYSPPNDCNYTIRGAIISWGAIMGKTPKDMRQEPKICGQRYTCKINFNWTIE